MGSKNAGKSEMRQANDLMKENIKRLEALGIPSIEAQQIALQNPELVGMLEAEQLGPSAMEGVSTDPRLKQAQMGALEQMSGLAETGLGAEDRAAMNQLRRSVGGEAQAQSAAALQNAAASGTLNSGNALMAQLMAGQNAANRGAEGADRLAAQASAARREALGMKANMATQMGQQDFSQKSSVANARDAISQFNTQNRQNTNQFNLQNRQALENQRAANANTQETHNKGLIQQNFQNEFQKASGVTGANTQLAGNLQQQGQAKAQGAADMNKGLTDLAIRGGVAYATGGASEIKK
jgi:hypothetical protein